MRIFVTHTCPKDRLMKYGLSLSASKFNYHLIDGGGFDKVYSIYPGYTRGVLDKPDDESFEAVYSKWRSKGRVRQWLARFVEQWQVFRKIPRGADVWFYNVTSLNCLVILLLRLFKRSCSVNIIVLDFSPDEKFHRAMLPIINSANGRICLSTDPRFKAENSLCLPGVIAVGESARFPKVERVSRDVLISGALKTQITMLSMVLDAFAEMPDINLHICGVLINDKEKVHDFAERYHNIHFYGKMPEADFQRLLHEVPVSLNTRNPAATENLCNFPSKVIEAFCHNRIVASTIKYRQLGNLKYFSLGSDKEAFKESIRAIFDRPEAELLTYANQGEDAERMFNADIWFDTMRKIEQHYHKRKTHS